MAGESIYLYTDGSVYVGGVRDNRRDGFGRMMFANGDVYEGDWQYNKKNGKGLYYYYHVETVYDGNWIQNMKEGWGTYYQQDGSWLEGDWKANRLKSRSGDGVDQPLARVKNILDFYTDRSGWREIVNRLQTLLDKRADENYNFMDARESDNLKTVIERERQEMMQIVQNVAGSESQRSRQPTPSRPDESRGSNTQSKSGLIVLDTQSIRKSLSRPT